jgi:hypothetical protein
MLKPIVLNLITEALMQKVRECPKKDLAAMLELADKLNDGPKSMMLKFCINGGFLANGREYYKLYRETTKARVKHKTTAHQTGLMDLGNFALGLSSSERALKKFAREASGLAPHKIDKHIACAILERSLD